MKPLAGEVPDVRHAVKRQQVVHAERVERDCPDDDQLVVALVVGEGRGIERLRCQQLGVGGDHSAWGVSHALVGQVGPQRAKQVLRGLLGGVCIDPRSLGGPID